MKITTIVEKIDPEDGSKKLYEFNAELNEAQHAYLIQFATGTLMARGIIPFDPTPEVDEGDPIPKELIN